MLDYYSTEARQEEIENSIIDELGNRYSQDFQKLLKGVDCTDVSIHPSCTIICNDAFRNCRSVHSIIIPDAVTAIGAYAFAGCIMLKSIRIPNSVSDMGIHAFDGCVGLESAELSCNLSFLPHCAFLNCSSLKTVSIPEGVTVIGKGAFCDCSSLKSIHLPESMTGIWHDAFWRTSLESVNIPDHLNMHPEAFAGCFYLKSVNISKEAYERLGPSYFPRGVHFSMGE